MTAYSKTNAEREKIHVALFPDLSIENWKSMDLYAEQLSRWLPHVAEDVQAHSVGISHSRWIDRHFRIPYLHRVVNDRFYSRYVVYPRAARHFQGDVNHVLDHSYGHILRSLDPDRTIVTVHDLYPLEVIGRSRLTLRDQVRKWLLGRVMTNAFRARWVIAVSEFTKGEILRLTDYPSSRISVVHMGVDDSFFQPVREETKRAFRFSIDVPEHATMLLHVGSCDERKNVPVLLQALRNSLTRTGSPCYLLQVGGTFTSHHHRIIAESDLAPRIRQCSSVSLNNLRCAYQSADIFLLPSSYEGFGLTALEAMASGTPVVASDIGPLPEILGESGLLIRPNDPDSLADGITQISTDGNLRARLIEEGRKRARNFTWLETARKTAEVYRHVHKERP